GRPASPSGDADRARDVRGCRALRAAHRDAGDHARAGGVALRRRDTRAPGVGCSSGALTIRLAAQRLRDPDPSDILLSVVDLSIIIVSFNARRDLERCLSSLVNTPPSISHGIAVVDNASSDGSAAAVRQWPQVRLIELPENRGFAAANNVGIRSTMGTNGLWL